MGCIEKKNKRDTNLFLSREFYPTIEKAEVLI